jgi:hypothetical protein
MFQAEVSLVFPAKLTAVLGIFEDAAEKVHWHQRDSETDIVSLQGEMEIGGGRGTDEVHEELRAAVRKQINYADLVTRWFCIDELPWDAEYGELFEDHDYVPGDLVKVVGTDDSFDGAYGKIIRPDPRSSAEYLVQIGTQRVHVRNEFLRRSK